MKTLNLPLLMLLAFFVLISTANSGDPTPSAPDPLPLHTPMTNQRIGKLLKKIDPKAEGRPGFWTVSFRGYQAQVITDNRADRMRIIIPVAPVSSLDSKRLTRLMQANFDSALDSRYCIARETLWAAFIHPLAALSDAQFLSGIAQTFNLAATYGSTYNSGALIFNGGDSQEKNDQYYQDIINKSKII